MPLKTKEPGQPAKYRQTLTGFSWKQVEIKSTEKGQNQDPILVHRLRSACGHLQSIVTAFEAGQPPEQTLHQLGAVEAALREMSLEIVKKELLQNMNSLRSSECDEERIKAIKRVLELYERYCR